MVTVEQVVEVCQIGGTVEPTSCHHKLASHSAGDIDFKSVYSLCVVRVTVSPTHLSPFAIAVIVRLY